MAISIAVGTIPCCSKSPDTEGQRHKDRARVRAATSENYNQQRPEAHCVAVLMPVDAAIGEPPVVALYRLANRDLEPKILLAIWKSGAIVWSKDAAMGGPPYRISHINQGEVGEIVKRLWQFDLFSKPELVRGQMEVDGDAAVFALADGTRRCWQGTSHEIAERAPDKVCADGGIRRVSELGKGRDEVLSHLPEDMKRFRQQWEEARKVLREHIPGSSDDLDDAKFDLKAIGTSGLHEDTGVETGRAKETN